MFLSDGGSLYRLEKLTDDGWIVRHVETNEVKTATSQSIYDAMHGGSLHEATDGSKNGQPDGTRPKTEDGEPRIESDAAMRVLNEKKQWIDALNSQGHHALTNSVWVRGAMSRLEKTELSGVRRYSIGTLAKAAAAVQKAGGDWSHAVPRFSERGGKGKTRTDPRAEKIIKEALDAEKQNKGPFIRPHVIDTIRARVLEINHALPEDPIRMPGDTTVDRRIAQRFTKFEIQSRNSGTAFAKKQYRENSYPRDRAQYPLEIPEYDDIDCGTFLVDDEIGLPVGRAFLTHGVCQGTDVPLGFDISHLSRSYESAIGAICCSLLPKDPGRREFGALANAWIGYGVQGAILLDNARYNHSKSANTAANEAKLALAGTRTYGPTEKCSIEHFNDITKSDFCSKLPGWRGDKNDPDSVKRALNDSCIDVHTFTSLYVRWVVGDYLNNPGEDGHTPKQRWQRHYLHHAPAVRWTRQQVALIRLRPIELTFRASGGVKRLGLVYNSDSLISLRREIGHRAKVVAFVDNADLGYVFIRHPRTFQLIRADYVGDPRYVKGLSAYQQALILKMARDRGRRNPSQVDMVRAREELARLVDQARRSHKLRERRWAERVGDVKVDVPNLDAEVFEDVTKVKKTKTVERVMTDLEWSIAQLEQVDIDMVDEDWQ